MLNFNHPIQIGALDEYPHREFLRFMTNYCLTGHPMHRDALISVVVKLTRISRDIGLDQNERDSAAALATNLANAGLTAYGSNSEFRSALTSGIQRAATDALS